jgi:hypothetical protein
MANFERLRTLLVGEFKGLLDVAVYPAKARKQFELGVHMFSNAFIVVGVHGAGFQNMAFMKGNGTYAIHCGGSRMWTLYARLARKTGVNFRNIYTDGAVHSAENVYVDEAVVLLEIWRILTHERVRGAAEAHKRRDAARGWPLRPERNRETVMMYDAEKRGAVYIYNSSN